MTAKVTELSKNVSMLPISPGGREISMFFLPFFKVDTSMQLVHSNVFSVFSEPVMSVPKSPVDLQHYAQRLLSSLSTSNGNANADDDNGGPLSPGALSPLQEDTGEKTGCREAIEVLTRNMKRGNAPSTSSL